MFLLFNLTFGGKVFLIICIACCIIVALIGLFMNDQDTKSIVGSAIIALIIILAVAGSVSWYNTNSAKGQRKIKNDQSNMQCGLDRKITIWYYGKDEPMVFEGKIDLMESEDYKVLEFILDGKKYIYYVGIMDRYIVEEK